MHSLKNIVSKPIYTIHNNESKIFSGNIKSHITNKPVILSFTSKHDANKFAYLLEKNDINPEYILGLSDNSLYTPNEHLIIPNFDNIELSKYKIENYDSHYLYRLLIKYNINLLICDKDILDNMRYTGNIYYSSDNPNDYVDIFNATYF